MKKIIYIIVLMLLSNFSIQSQNTKLFRFITKNDINGTKHVLFHNLETNALETKPIPSEEYNATYGFLESFIIKPVGNNGEVYIASAKAPEYFLKRVGSGNGQALSFVKKGMSDEIGSYKWQIIVGENSGETIAIEASDFGHLAIFYRNGEVFQEYFKNTEENPITTTENNKIIAPRFLFKIESINNVF